MASQFRGLGDDVAFDIGNSQAVQIDRRCGFSAKWLRL